jgi:tetratricopeptide (TPR) repeat protein
MAVRLAQRGIELEPASVVLPNTLGVAHYRAGDWPKAIEWLEKSQEVRNGGDSFDWYFLAMAHWQLDNKDEARKFFEQAVEWMDINAADNQELKRFRAEADELLGVEKNEPAVTTHE